jgi:hypothetical protein
MMKDKIEKKIQLLKITKKPKLTELTHKTRDSSYEIQITL